MRTRVWFVGADVVTCRGTTDCKIDVACNDLQESEAKYTCPYTHCTRVHKSELLHEQHNKTTPVDVAMSVRGIRAVNHHARPSDVTDTHLYLERRAAYIHNKHILRKGRSYVRLPSDVSSSETRLESCTVALAISTCAMQVCVSFSLV
jgi:hypothetical protein